MDVSGSVSVSEYNIQKTGYMNAFNNASIQSAIAGITGGIAVSYIEWSGASQQSQLVGWSHLTDAASSSAFASAISGVSRAFSGNTAPGSALNFAAPLFSNNGFEGLRWVIDVSGDGQQNEGSDTASARSAFLNIFSGSEGLSKTINGLPIGSQTLANWYQDNIVSASGFLVQASDFDDFGNAVLTKIGREIRNEVPEPASLALLSLGLAGLGFARRRKQA